MFNLYNIISSNLPENVSFYSNGILLDEKTLEVFVECSETFANKCNSTDWFTRRMITLTAIMSSNNGFGEKKEKLKRRLVCVGFCVRIKYVCSFAKRF